MSAGNNGFVANKMKLGLLYSASAKASLRTEVAVGNVDSSWSNFPITVRAACSWLRSRSRRYQLTSAVLTASSLAGSDIVMESPAAKLHNIFPASLEG